MTDDITTPYSLTPATEPKQVGGPGRPKRILTELELRCNEVYLRAKGTQIEKVNFTQAELKRRYGQEVNTSVIIDAIRCLAGRRYREKLYNRTRDTALRTLAKEVPAVLEDYKWSRDAAKEQGDYKEVRLAAVDHLDRLGVTLKREQPQVQAQVIVLKGSNFDVSTLDAPTPEVLATEIVQEEGDAS